MLCVMQVFSLMLCVIHNVFDLTFCATHVLELMLCVVHGSSVIFIRCVIHSVSDLMLYVI